MNWFTLLKQPKLRVGNKVTTNLGSKSESQDDNCERKVREYADKVRNYKQNSSYWGKSTFDGDEEYFPNLPEEVYCKILNQLNRIQPNDKINEFVKKNRIQYSVGTSYYYYPNNEEASFEVRVYHNDFSVMLGMQHKLALYIILVFDNRTAGLSREEALKKVDFR